LSMNGKKQVRFSDPAALDREQMENELRNGSHVILQFSHPSHYATLLQDVDEICAQWDESFCVRFYGHYFSSFDCNTVLQLPNVKTLYLDCLTEAHNTEALSRLENLYDLNLNIYELKDSEILRTENLQSLRRLGIASEKKTVNLEYLKSYSHLKTLSVSGKVKSLDTIGSLNNLEFLALHSISKLPINFINNLSKLRTLKFLLGGRENILEIEENEIETLEIVRVRGFNDIQNITKFRKLRKLVIEDQVQLNSIILNEVLEELEEVVILNCKGLASLAGLDKLPSLHTLRIYKTSIDFDSFIRQKLPDSLSSLHFKTSKKKVDQEIQKTLIEMGLQK
jgi:protein phosphatase 1 regulatory subunit 7